MTTKRETPCGLYSPQIFVNCLRPNGVSCRERERKKERKKHTHTHTHTHTEREREKVVSV